MPRILICEDNTALANDFVSLLAGDARFELVAAVASGEEAIELLSQHAVDVLLLDLGLPGIHGFDVLAAMRRLQPSCEALVVTVFGDEHTVIRAIEAGASGYVLKREVALNLIRRIDELLAGGSPITPSIARLLLRRVQSRTEGTAPVSTLAPRAPAQPNRPSQLNYDSHTSDASNASNASDTSDDSADTAALSGREIEVLTFVSKGLSVQEVGDLLLISSNTVKTYIRRIYKKLEVSSRIEAVYEARALGLLDQPAAAAWRGPDTH